MQENLVSAAPNVILDLLQVKLCKILDCLRPFNDAKPAKSQAGGNVSSAQAQTIPEYYR